MMIFCWLPPESPAAFFRPAVFRADIVFFDQLIHEVRHFLLVDHGALRKFRTAVFLKDRVLTAGKLQDEAVLVAVFRNGRQPLFARAKAGEVFWISFPSMEMVPLSAFLQVVHRFHQFLLSVAVDAGDADDLALPGPSGSGP
jgi:hypothetical protein